MGLRSFVRRKIIKKIKDKFGQNNVELEPPVAFSRFESLGYNCEFGFVLRKYNNEISSFFRWTFIYDYKKIYELIFNDFKNVFLPENLEPHFYSRTSVIDTYYNLTFHVSAHNKLINNKPQYVDSEEILKQKRIQDIEKITHLKEKFLNNIFNKKIIYVIKDVKLNQRQDIANLAKLIKRKSKRKCKVLCVRVTDNKNKLYTIKKHKSNFFIGYIDRFSMEHQADNCNYDGWLNLLINAEKLIK